MVLQSDISKIKYVCDGAAKTFPIPFKFFKNKDGTAQIKIYFKNGDEEKILEENVDYTITGAGADISAKAEFGEPPIENAQIMILRDKPLLQEQDYVNGEYIDMEELEGGFDGAYMAMQGLEEKVNRAILIDIFSDDMDAKDFAETLLGYKNAAQKAANEAIEAAQSAAETVDKLGQLADEINGEII